MDRLEAFKAFLRGRGKKLTLQRFHIAKAVFQAGAGLSPEELYELALKEQPSLGRSTYRQTLQLLEKSGLLEQRVP